MQYNFGLLRSVVILGLPWSLLVLPEWVEVISVSQADRCLYTGKVSSFSASLVSLGRGKEPQAQDDKDVS